MGCHTYDWLIEGGNGVPNNYLDDGEAAFAREFPELEEMLRDEENKSEDYQHPSSTTFLPFIRTVQRIVLYETKSVSEITTNSMEYMQSLLRVQIFGKSFILYTFTKTV